MILMLLTRINIFLIFSSEIKCHPSGVKEIPEGCRCYQNISPTGLVKQFCCAFSCLIRTILWLSSRQLHIHPPRWSDTLAAPSGRYFGSPAGAQSFFVSPVFFLFLHFSYPVFELFRTEGFPQAIYLDRKAEWCKRLWETDDDPALPDALQHIA